MERPEPENPDLGRQWFPADARGARPFTARSGSRLLYVWSPQDDRHAFFDVGERRVLPDDEAMTRLFGEKDEWSAPRAQDGERKLFVADEGRVESFRARSGARLLYVWDPRSDRHALLDLDEDRVLWGEDAAEHLFGRR